MFKMNKALDYSGLLESQAQGKLLKKNLKFPLIVQTKYDGNAVVVEVRDGRTRYYTSGGLEYTHTDDGAICFRWAVDGYYVCERIAGKGKLGDRVRCNLRGPKANQTSTNHSYKVFDFLTIAEYEQGFSNKPYDVRYTALLKTSVYQGNIPDFISWCNGLNFTS